MAITRPEIVSTQGQGVGVLLYSESLGPLGRATWGCGEATRMAALESPTRAVLANSANQLSRAQEPSVGPLRTSAAEDRPLRTTRIRMSCD